MIINKSFEHEDIELSFQEGRVISPCILIWDLEFFKRNISLLIELI